MSLQQSACYLHRQPAARPSGVQLWDEVLLRSATQTVTELSKIRVGRLMAR